jgi:hypothetical protein
MKPCQPAVIESRNVKSNLDRYRCGRHTIAADSPFPQILSRSNGLKRTTTSLWQAKETVRGENLYTSWQATSQYIVLRPSRSSQSVSHPFHPSGKRRFRSICIRVVRGAYVCRDTVLYRYERRRVRGCDVVHVDADGNKATGDTMMAKNLSGLFRSDAFVRAPHVHVLACPLKFSPSRNPTFPVE